MHKEETVQKIIELRAQGWTYGQLMTELNASKPTLIHVLCAERVLAESRQQLFLHAKVRSGDAVVTRTFATVRSSFRAQKRSTENPC